MNNLIVKRDLLCDLHFIALVSTIWLALISTASGYFTEVSYLEISFSVLAAITALLIFRALESVDTFRALPKPSDIVLMTAAFVLGALLADLSLHFTFHKPALLFADLLLVKSVPLALALFASHYFYSTVSLSFERKKKVVLHMEPRQNTSLMQDLACLKVANYVEFLGQSDLEAHLRRGAISEIDLIIISREAAKAFEPEATLLRAHLAGIPILDAGEIRNKIIGRVRLNETDLSTYLLGATHKTLVRRTLLKAKYSIEPLIALLLAIAFLPLMVFIALLIRLDSPGPVLYFQRRTGYMGRRFYLIKFRSMIERAEINGPQWASSKDRRVTAIGHFLRRTRLDELPQLWNIMCGEMSFIGPRPERPEIYERLREEVPLFSLRTLVRPGITGWAQVCAGYAASSAESLLKLEYDLFYIQHMSLRFDLNIILKTLKVFFVGDKAARSAIGASSPPVVVWS